ncbi:putative lipid-binding transport protein (Tim44 family) [Sulfuritortus calidifontis]|uniref:Putative lipid-binding transport protein (Tim44 family) n=1 Tax=Sulfuritortus calidifontis TaxID=1914471 RepID=A0A4V2UQ75_9PROT|nr:TIM44-like domain-containing protein [Sulfuritortus calidifontis]TCS69006.1 putative lipid-binding transport protein (Tim44 family) [Sulfuritortus calidifontis]
MTRFLTALLAVFVGLALPLHDAEAKRFGGGKSSGMQRQITPQQPASAPSKNVAAPSQNNAGAAAAQPGKRSWMGPIAGLAAGLGLAALASHFGFGEEMANFLMIALLIMAAIFLFKFLTRKRQQPAMQYAGAAAGGNVMPFQAEPVADGSAAPQAGHAAALPAGFDAEAFSREAKLNFLRMQAAYDAGNIDDIREFTSPEMFAEIRLQLTERGAAKQQTDVTLLNADVLECAEEGNKLRVSVRFHGLVREEANGAAEAFDEVWHLTKPADGSHGWVVAGIQQLN